MSVSSQSARSKKSRARKPARRPKLKVVRKPRPRGAMLDTDLFICVCFDEHGAPYAYSADVEEDLVKLPSGTGGYVMVPTKVTFPFAKMPTVRLTAEVKGGAA